MLASALAFFLALPLSALSARAGGASDAPLVILDVPYFPQSPDLCGAAAAAMVLRYWGEPATPEDFAPLLDREARGIPAATLTEAIRRRGLTAVSFPAEAALVRLQLERGRPVIGLIGVGQGRLHYVVILAWANGRVLLHDPAQAPFRVLREQDLLRAWRAGDDWALVVSKPEAPARTLSPNELDELGAQSGGAAGPPCATLVDQGVALARAGEAAAAELRLQAAAVLCPDSGAPFRELAGLRFQAQHWREAARLAEQATRREPSDAHAWRTLAASRYLGGDGRGALSAFNQLGEPSLDLLRIDGLERTRFAALERRLRAKRDSVLTVHALDCFRRRLQDVPALRSSRVAYRPGGEGQADLEVAVVERPLVSASTTDLARLAARAWSEREVELSLASPAKEGELVSLAWRFWEPRPAFGLNAVAPLSFGTLLAAIRWETESYARASSAAPLRERQRGVSLAVSDWTRAGVKWELGGSLQSIRDRGSLLGPSTAIETRSAREHLAFFAKTSVSFPVGGRGERFLSWELGSAWRSAPKDAASLQLRAGWRATSSSAPLSHWSGAGTGSGRSPLLRAHPLLDDGVVAGAVFGRRLISGGAELAPAWISVGVLQVGLALFADAAWATRRELPGATGHLDAGVGVRLRLAGGGAVRIDFARGLRDGRQAFSAGWIRTWPALGER